MSCFEQAEFGGSVELSLRWSRRLRVRGAYSAKNFAEARICDCRAVRAAAASPFLIASTIGE